MFGQCGRRTLKPCQLAKMSPPDISGGTEISFYLHLTEIMIARYLFSLIWGLMSNSAWKLKIQNHGSAWSSGATCPWSSVLSQRKLLRLDSLQTKLDSLQTSINHTDDLKTVLRDPFLLFSELKHCCDVTADSRPESPFGHHTGQWNTSSDTLLYWTAL